LVEFVEAPLSRSSCPSIWTTVTTGKSELAGSESSAGRIAGEAKEKTLRCTLSLMEISA